MMKEHNPFEETAPKVQADPVKSGREERRLRRKNARKRFKKK